MENELEIDVVLGNLDFGRKPVTIENVEEYSGLLRTVYQQFSQNEIYTYLLTKIDATSPETLVELSDKFDRRLNRLERDIQYLAQDKAASGFVSRVHDDVIELNDSVGNWKMSTSVLWFLAALALLLSIIS